MSCSGGDDSPYEYAPVTGTVKFEDGTVLNGDIATIRFVPDGISRQGKNAPNPATGDIKDGQFELATGSEKGAIVGKHTVEIIFIKKYPAQPLSYTPEPSSVKVVSGDNNTITFTIKKSSGKKKD